MEVHLLEANKVTPEDLRSVRQPRLTQCENIPSTSFFKSADIGC